MSGRATKDLLGDGGDKVVESPSVIFVRSHLRNTYSGDRASIECGNLLSLKGVQLEDFLLECGLCG